MATSVCVLLSLWAGVCVASNLDTSFPLLKTGRDGSLFGLSVALHQDLKTDTYLLLAGAPKDKAEASVPANRTGGVYSCPITADQSECTRIKLIDPDQLLSSDWVEDMWLGVSVASQGPPGGRVLACGHRFVKLYGSFNTRQMIGQCYVRGNDLQYHEEEAVNWQSPDLSCSHVGDLNNEAMCTMGISAAITQTEIIAGAPGSYTWQGNVHVAWMDPDDLYDTRRTNFPNMNYGNIYIGYSVTQAFRLLSQDEETVVTGAPKDNKEDVRGSVLLVKKSNQLVIQQKLRGEQTGSYFGNAVATSDLNNDGWNDLLVGAPFYFQHQEEAGGAVYVYMNAGGRFDSAPSVVLRGPVGSAFGMAICAVGDLNQDGFQDFAVGAPFHESGSVMIWTGSKDGVSTEPSQVIWGNTVSSGFRTFGYSLSGGVDVDGNKYPDLLVGSLDDTVALLRTRPVIHLNKTLKVSPERVDTTACDYCIQVEVCFSYMFSTGEKSDRDNITVQFTLTADMASHEPRLRFRNGGQSVYSGFLSMPKKQCKTLRVGLLGQIRDKVNPLVFSLNASLYEELPKKRNAVQDLKHFPVLSHTPRPIRSQIHIKKACGSDNRCQSNLQMTAQFTDENQKPFPKEKDIQMWNYTGNINRLFLEVNVSNTASPGRPAEDAHNAVLSISIPQFLIYAGVRTKRGVKAAVECSVEDTGLLCELGNPFKSNQMVQVLIIFQPSEISLDTREIQSVLQLSTLSEQSDLLPLPVSMLVDYSLQTSLILINPPGFTSFSGDVMGELAMKTTEDVGSLVVFTLQVHIQGKPLGHLGTLEVEFDWPMAVSNGKWLLYLAEIRMNGTSQSHCAPPGNIINSLNLKRSKKDQKERRRRSLEEKGEKKMDSQGKTLPVLHLQGKKKKSYTLDCVHGAKCVKFTCPLVNMNNSATLTVRARLWNSTMIEDYSDAGNVLVRSQATLKLQTSKPSISMESHSTEIEIQIYPDQGQYVDPGAPLWIMVVSVLAGVFLLALICLLLWKCGFFERRRTWRATVLHQGRILDKDQQQQHTDANGFLIQDQGSSSRGRKAPKHWVTSWTETH